ncbi:MAG: transglycosylase SLT domain-containing protein [Anaerolineales bacterium]
MPESKSRVRKTGSASQPGLTTLQMVFRLVLGLAILGAIFLFSQPDSLVEMREAVDTRMVSQGASGQYDGIRRGDAELAELFSPEVLYWEEDIRRWGQQRSLNPNLLATIMQIESCGNPHAISIAGAQGLFQVMPLHFEYGENQMNPETNAQNGIDHLVDCLVWSDYNLGESFACYNAGPSVIGVPQNRWPTESQYYYNWGTGIYGDASRGLAQSDTLARWQTAGGRLLCEDARAVQELFQP